jgi:hypothetical protein
MKDITAPITYKTKDGIGCRFPVIYWVKVANFDDHISLIRRSSMPPEPLNIEMVPWIKDGLSQVVEKDYVTFKAGGLNYRLIRPIHDWITANGYQYAFYRDQQNDELGWFVGFLNKMEAVHFKLTW